MADALDRSHNSAIREIEVYPSVGLVDVVVHADDDIDLELWSLRRKRELFSVLQMRLEVVEGQLALPLTGRRHAGLDRPNRPCSAPRRRLDI